MNSYKYEHNSYPVFSEELSYEGAFKRFAPMPGPNEVFQLALFGLPKVTPYTQEIITPDMAAPYLESAITELEMSLGVTLSPVVRFHSEDYIDGMFSSNHMGIRLQSWPATEIIAVKLKYPHAHVTTPYQVFTIPPHWIYLRKNKLNLVASNGTVSVTTDNSTNLSSGGIFTFMSGFTLGLYQPGVIEIVYKSGFEHDKLPSSVADLIKTTAAHRFLVDMMPVLFPTASVNDSIDGVSQSVSMNIHMTLGNRLEMLEKKKAELSAALVKHFSRTLKTTFLGT